MGIAEEVQDVGFTGGFLWSSSSVHIFFRGSIYYVFQLHRWSLVFFACSLFQYQPVCSYLCLYCGLSLYLRDGDKRAAAVSFFVSVMGMRGVRFRYLLFDLYALRFVFPTSI